MFFFFLPSSAFVLKTERKKVNFMCNKYLSVKNRIRMEPFLTKNTKNGTKQNGLFSSKNGKNGTERNMDGTDGKRTNKDGRIQLKALDLDRNETILKKSERAQL